MGSLGLGNGLPVMVLSALRSEIVERSMTVLMKILLPLL